ncbi:MAG TPA: hypothetical protein VFB38_18145 [Chthonomonadaceae bacterium]|nr:hypothetical protein [Chthonomonadaceae bacterium]
MRIATYLRAIATLATILGSSDCQVGRALSLPVPGQAQIKKPGPEKEPTFEETKRFILKYTRRKWQESPGNRDSYSLTFVNKRLKYIHTFTSEFMVGFVEKIEVVLSDLDPEQVGARDEEAPLLSLATTNGERKIRVEVTLLVPIDGAADRKYTDRLLWVPGSDQETLEAQDKMDERLKKAWAHLIKLSGGKQSQDEPF